jgi:hypothetical protein
MRDDPAGEIQLQIGGVHICILNCHSVLPGNCMKPDISKITRFPTLFFRDSANSISSQNSAFHKCKMQLLVAGNLMTDWGCSGEECRAVSAC